jgi:hypothetical protein
MPFIEVILAVKFRFLGIQFGSLGYQHRYTIPVPIPLPNGSIVVTDLNKSGVTLKITISESSRSVLSPPFKDDGVIIR